MQSLPPRRNTASAPRLVRPLLGLEFADASVRTAAAAPKTCCSATRSAAAHNFSPRPLRWPPPPPATGERSAPERGKITLLMRKQVKRAVRHRLEDKGEGPGATHEISFR